MGGGWMLAVNPRSGERRRAAPREHPRGRLYRVDAGPRQLTEMTDADAVVAAYAGDLGPLLRDRVFVCQDGANETPGSSGNEECKLVPFDAVADA
jgi:myo-inositol-hexaphosphate 3-phosphohydrolase